jgi:hypothetical protein
MPQGPMVRQLGNRKIGAARDHEVLWRGPKAEKIEDREARWLGGLKAEMARVRKARWRGMMA